MRMRSANKLFVKFILFCILFAVCFAGNNETSLKKTTDGAEFTGRLLEEGRTLVHHAIKRFMIILPAIFFKLGIAFTMLVLVTIVSVNNGFIGFLLLIVGISSVLARFQEARKPTAVPYFGSLPTYHHRYLQDWDRNDKGIIETSIKSQRTQDNSNYNQKYINTPLSTYNPSYYG